MTAAVGAFFRRPRLKRRFPASCCGFRTQSCSLYPSGRIFPLKPENEGLLFPSASFIKGLWRALVKGRRLLSEEKLEMKRPTISSCGFQVFQPELQKFWHERAFSSFMSNYRFPAWSGFSH